MLTTFRAHLLRATAVGLTAAALLAATPDVGLAQERTYAFDRPQQSLSRALRDYGRTTRQQIMFTEAQMAGRTAPALRGQYTAGDALDRLLSGSGLRATRTATGALIIERAPANPQGAAAPAAAEVSEVTVTGTNIRGSAPVGRNLLILNREVIDSSGQATIQGVLQNLPQNFRGGPNEGNAFGAGALNNDNSFASSINLRGLGAGSTLVLVNGRRMAPAGGDGSVVDVSSIPLAAVERVDVLLDGASAVYGSDAVGGVVNMILRRNYDGAETRFQTSVPTHGGGEEYSIQQTLGKSWGNGSAMIAYDRYWRENLGMADRDFLASADLRPLGGGDFRITQSNPGTITVAGVTYAVPTGQNGAALTPASFTAGTVNRSNQNTVRSLLPKQTRDSVFATVRQSFGDRFEVSADAIGSRRKSVASTNVGQPVSVPRTNAFYVNPTGGTGNVSVSYDFTKDFGPQVTAIDVDTFFVGLDARYRPARDWTLSLQASHGRQVIENMTRNQINTTALAAALADSNRATAFNAFGDGAFTNPATIEKIRSYTAGAYDSRASAVTFSVSGKLIDLPAGALSVAVGGEYREQYYKTAVTPATGPANLIRTQMEREIRAYFAEARAPLLADLPLIQKLEASVATRYEKYSDFGSKQTPAASLEWTPIENLHIRGGWAKSFKAPTLPSLMEKNNIAYITSTADRSSPTGLSPVLAALGSGNADLSAETSTTWSTGVAWQPSLIPGLTVTAGYFDIRFDNRIQSYLLQFSSFLNDPRFASFAIRNPTQAQRAAVCSRYPLLISQNDCLNAPIAAILTATPQNAAATRERGLDFTLQYRRDLPVGALSAAFSATHILSLKEAITDAAPKVELSDTQFQPNDLRATASATWTYDGWSLSGTARYIGGFKDLVSAPNRKVDAWTGLDLAVRYRFAAKGLLAGSEATLRVNNVFDTEPSFFNNAAGLSYDPTNTDMSAILGRTVSLILVKSW